MKYVNKNRSLNKIALFEKVGVICHVYFKCFNQSCVRLDHTLVVFSRFVLFVLKMFFFWAKNRGSLFLNKTVLKEQKACKKYEFM